MVVMWTKRLVVITVTRLGGDVGRVRDHLQNMRALFGVHGW
jgi:hypothetical protein